MMAMVVFGIGEMCGCFLAGWLIDKKGSKFMSRLNIAFIAFAVLSILLYPSSTECRLYSLVMTFMWGFQDSAVNTQLSEVLAFQLTQTDPHQDKSNDSAEAFSVFNMIQAFSVFLFELLESDIDTHPSHVLYALFLGVFGLSSSLLASFFQV
jgi:predicted MFS family arabinose efflux permease